MYSSKFKIFFSFIILVLIIGVAAFVIFPKFKNKNKDRFQNLALVDLSTLDSDQDGLSDKKEQELNTNPYNLDTDGDGYSDAEEVKTGHDPSRVESKNLLDEDEDGLINEDEKKYGTNPKNSDSDYDGYSDGAEVAAGHNPLKADLSSLTKLTSGNAQVASSVKNLESALNAQNPQDLQTNLAAIIKAQGQEKQYDFSQLPSDVDDKDINIKGEANQQTVQAYVNSIGILVFRLLPFTLTDQDNIQEFFSSFDPNDLEEINNDIKKLEKGYNLMKDLEVPNDQELISWHKKALSFLKKSKSLIEKWKEMKGDIYAMTEVFRQIQVLQSRALNDLLPELESIGKKYNIEVPNNLEFFKGIPR